MCNIKSYEENKFDNEDRTFCASFALIKVTKCLYEVLKLFNTSLKGSFEESFWWTQYERRFDEQNFYCEMLSEDIVEAIFAYVRKNNFIPCPNAHYLDCIFNLQKDLQ